MCAGILASRQAGAAGANYDTWLSIRQVAEWGLDEEVHAPYLQALLEAEEGNPQGTEPTPVVLGYNDPLMRIRATTPPPPRVVCSAADNPRPPP
eukprot:3814288-Pyramimonas_sp.AAC.1